MANKIGDELINDAGTHVTVVENPEDGKLEPGTIPLELVPAFLEAGYERVKLDQPIPQQVNRPKAADSDGTPSKYHVVVSND